LRAGRQSDRVNEGFETSDMDMFEAQGDGKMAIKSGRDFTALSDLSPAFRPPYLHKL
jgi:hypothetical protein